MAKFNRIRIYPIGKIYNKTIFLYNLFAVHNAWHSGGVLGLSFAKLSEAKAKLNPETPSSPAREAGFLRGELLPLVM